MREDFPADRDRHPFDDAYWASKRPELERIQLPALVCAGWGDQGLHTRGSLEGFKHIGSRQKWLFTHGRRKWETFYSREAKDYQRRFLDHFLKGEPNGWENTPPVRLEVRQDRTRHAVRSELGWPLQDLEYRPLYLDANDSMLHPVARRDAGEMAYESQIRTSRASFIYRFQDEAELTGGMSLKLWVSTTEGEDLDLFVLLRKFEASGREVCFSGYNGYAKDGVAKGWLRVSHRGLHEELSRPGQPVHAHLRERRCAPAKSSPSKSRSGVEHAVRAELEISASIFLEPTPRATRRSGIVDQSIAAAMSYTPEAPTDFASSRAVSSLTEAGHEARNTPYTTLRILRGLSM